MNSYQVGFMNKCAEYGVNPADLSQYIESNMQKSAGIGSGIAKLFGKIKGSKLGRGVGKLKGRVGESRFGRHVAAHKGAYGAGAAGAAGLGAGYGTRAALDDVVDPSLLSQLANWAGDHKGALIGGGLGAAGLTGLGLYLANKAKNDDDEE